MKKEEELTILFDRVLLSALMLDFLERKKAGGMNPQGAVDDLVLGWRKRCRQKLDEEINAFQSDESEEARVARCMAKIVGRGDGEQMRLESVQTIQNAEDHIREWMDQLVEVVG